MVDTVQDSPRNNLFSRIWGYPLVHYAVGTAGDYYNYAKAYNQYSKRAFETAESYAQPLAVASWTKLEEYSHQPIVEGIITRADAYGCQQLDKIEETIHNIKESAPKKLQAVENVIHGSRVEVVLIKTVSLLDNVVDALLPPTEAEDEASASGSDDGAQSESSENNGTLIEVTGPVIHKLRARVSKESVLRLPGKTYNELYGLALRKSNSLPQLTPYINLLKSASTYILATKQATQQKGHDLSKFSIDYVYQSLHRVSSSVNSLVGTLKKLDTKEARATVNELSSMIAASKDNVSKIIDNLHLAQKLKEDSSAILLRAGDALSRNVQDGYVRVANSDIAAIRNAFTSLESAVQSVVASFSIQAEQNSE